MFVLTHVLFKFTPTVSALRLTNTKVSIIALFILKSGLWISFCLWLCPIVFSLFYFDRNIIFCVLIITLFNTHSHIHEFIVLIAGATLLHRLVFTVCSLSWLTNTKVIYIVPPFRHFVCHLCIICTLASILTDTQWHKHVLCLY